MTQKRLDISALILYSGFIFWLSSQSTLIGPDLFENIDKLEHLLAYFAMGIFAWRALSHFPLRRNALLLASSGFCAIYGFSDEWHQSFVAGRDANVLDWLADSLGGLLAAFCSYWVTGKNRT